MRRSLALLSALAVCLLACGHYGPPERTGPHPTSASEARDAAACEETEKSE